MSRNEYQRPALDERTIPNHGRSMDDFEPELRPPIEIYETDRKRKIDQIEGMVEPYKGEVLDTAQKNMVPLFKDLREKVANNPLTNYLGNGIYEFHLPMSIDGQEMKVNCFLTDCAGMANTAKTLTIGVVPTDAKRTPKGSYLISKESESITQEFGLVKKEAHRAYGVTAVDVSFYRKVEQSLPACST